MCAWSRRVEHVSRDSEETDLESGLKHPAVGTLPFSQEKLDMPALD